jgi:uncharacterized protein (UPF0332 family)
VRELTARQHLSGAEANLAFADQLHRTQGNDFVVVGWAITALFYAAVHAVRAYLLARHGIRVAAHEDMRRLLQEHPELKRTHTSYNHLKQQSESARYYLNPAFTWSDYESLLKDAQKVLATWKPLITRTPSA